MKKIDKRIVCAYLYSITKYGYPPKASDTLKHIEEMHNLGFSSIELEGIREDHLLEIYNSRNLISSRIKELNLTVPSDLHLHDQSMNLYKCNAT